MLGLEVVTSRACVRGPAGYTAGYKTHRPWVAKVTGRDDVYGLEREFLDHLNDYDKATKNTRRGVLWWFILDDGFLYQVQENVGSQRHRRYFAKVDDGLVVEVDQEEANAWLDRPAA